VTPFGAAHQRLFEGLAAGGFFLLRGVAGDAIDLMSERVWHWCKQAGVTNAREMISKGQTDPTFQQLMAQLKSLKGVDPMSEAEWFYAGLQEAALGGFSHCASQLWAEYDRVAFWNHEQLTEKVRYFLTAADERRAISQSMRRAALQWHTYSAISQRMLTFIADDLAAQAKTSAEPQTLAEAA
jgi:hypothetical protein